MGAEENHLVFQLSAQDRSNNVVDCACCAVHVVVEVQDDILRRGTDVVLNAFVVQTTTMPPGRQFCRFWAMAIQRTEEGDGIGIGNGK